MPNPEIKGTCKNVLTCMTVALDEPVLQIVAVVVSISVVMVDDVSIMVKAVSIMVGAVAVMVGAVAVMDMTAIVDMVHVSRQQRLRHFRGFL